MDTVKIHSREIAKEVERKIREHFTKIGRRGGKSKSRRKKMSSRKNVALARAVKKAKGEVQHGPANRNERVVRQGVR